MFKSETHNLGHKIMIVILNNRDPNNEDFVLTNRIYWEWIIHFKLLGNEY